MGPIRATCRTGSPARLGRRSDRSAAPRACGHCRPACARDKGKHCPRSGAAKQGGRVESQVPPGCQQPGDKQATSVARAKLASTSLQILAKIQLAPDAVCTSRRRGASSLAVASSSVRLQGTPNPIPRKPRKALAPANVLARAPRLDVGSAPANKINLLFAPLRPAPHQRAARSPRHASRPRKPARAEVGGICTISGPLRAHSKVSREARARIRFRATRR